MRTFPCKISPCILGMLFDFLVKWVGFTFFYNTRFAFLTEFINFYRIHILFTNTSLHSNFLFSFLVILIFKGRFSMVNRAKQLSITCYVRVEATSVSNSEEYKRELKHSLMRWSLGDENRSNFYDFALMNKVQLQINLSSNESTAGWVTSELAERKV